MFERIYSDIRNNGADWVLIFKAEFSDKARKDREVLEQAWRRCSRSDVQLHFPNIRTRNVSEVAFSNAIR